MKTSSNIKGVAGHEPLSSAARAEGLSYKLARRLVAEGRVGVLKIGCRLFVEGGGLRRALQSCRAG